jgi:hypothetical protein
VLSRCPLSENDSFFTLWAQFQQHQASAYSAIAQTTMCHDSPLRLLITLHPALQTFMMNTPFVPQVPMDPAIVGFTKKDIPRHLSALDIATGGRPRPPPQMRWGDAPVVVVPMASELAARLSGLVSSNIPMTGVPMPLPLPSSVCGRRSPGTEEMWEERSRSARTSASTQSDAQRSDDTSMAAPPGSGIDGAEPCYLWRQLGMCNRPQCRFAHGLVVGTEEQMLDLSKPLRVCHFHVPGSLFSACKKGSTCEFLHL